MTEQLRAPRKYNVTSYDVAEEARVSQATVSRALRGKGRVKAETRRRVLNAAKALGYQIDSRASALRSLKVECVAVILVCTHPECGGDEFEPRFALIRQVYGAISALGFEMILSIQSPQNPRDDFISRRRAQTSIVIGQQSDLTQWASGVDSDPNVARFASFCDAAEAWLRDAVQSCASRCEIVLANASGDSLRQHT